VDILSVKGVTKKFGAVNALTNVNFNLKKGEIHALVGHNGAGKSTFVKVLTGTYIPDSGTINLYGEKTTFIDPKDAINQGIGIVTQEGSLIPDFNVIENIYLGQEHSKSGFINNQIMRRGVRELIAKLGIEIDLYKQVKYLNPAQRKLVEVLKIMNINPRILILDEPTAALSSKEREKLFSVMRTLIDEGITIIFITHYLDEVFEMSDRITVLRNGLHAGTRITKESNQDEIVKLMIDKDNHNEYPYKDNDIGDIIFQAKNISDNEKLNKISLTVSKGEIVGVFGTVGSGRTEFAEVVYGARNRKTGEVFIDGNRIRNKNSVPTSIKNGLVLIPDDRLTKSLILGDSVKSNISLPFLGEQTIIGWINSKRELKKANGVVQDLSIKIASVTEKVENLSGGNKQKVSFGKWMISDKNKPRIFIFDEPTEGVDVGARAEMYRIMVNLAEAGAGIMLISSDISEIKGLSDRVYIMSEGKIVDEIPKKEMTDERLIESSIGVIDR
jgi:ABC-type sugar transport system ATPase subunit